MNNIGFKNFRRFHNFPKIDLGDVTLLVGGNNSGKSTLVKALLLCLDNLKLATATDEKNLFAKAKFHFDGNQWHDVKIKTFSRAITNTPIIEENNKISVPTEIEFSFAIGFFEFVVRVSSNGDENSATGVITYVSIQDWMQARRYVIDYSNGTMSYLVTGENVEPVSAHDRLSEQLKNAEQLLEELSTTDDFEAIAKQNDTVENLKEKIENLEDSHLSELTVSGRIQWVTIDPEKNPEEYKRAAEQIMDFDFYEGIVSRYDIHGIEDHNDVVGKNFFVNVISSFAKLERNLPNLFESVQNSDKNTKRSSENKPEFTAEEKEQLKNRKFILSETDYVMRSVEALEDLIATLKVEYITAHAANQNTLYNTADKDDINASVVHEFYKSRIYAGEPEHQFILKWMKEFQIGSSFEIKSIDGEAYRIIIKDAKGYSVNLADKGMGSIQLMILLLRLATIIRNNKLVHMPNQAKAKYAPLILIEEPEQNLRPKFQSLLADLFKSANDEFGCRFVIETHSEYLIRKSQVLVAGEKYEDAKALEQDNPFSVFYFESEEESVRKMIYRTDGVFENDFGEGFFDESENLAFKIL